MSATHRVYLALGDSLAVGVGATDPARGGYVGRFFARLRAAATPTTAAVDRLINLAGSGETSGSMIAGGQLERALRTIGDLGAALRVVTLDIGGNDLLWLAGTEPCASAPNSEACRRAVIGTLDRYEANYRAILERIVDAVRRGAGDEATVLAVTYYNPFSGTGHLLEMAGDEALLGADLRVDCSAAAATADDRGINDVIVCTAHARGAAVADVYPRFVGRGAALTLMGYGDVHANDAGYAEMAEELTATVARARSIGP